MKFFPEILLCAVCRSNLRLLWKWLKNGARTQTHAHTHMQAIVQIDSSNYLTLLPMRGVRISVSTPTMLIEIFVILLSPSSQVPT